MALPKRPSRKEVRVGKRIFVVHKHDVGGTRAPQIMSEVLEAVGGKGYELPPNYGTPGKLIKRICEQDGANSILEVRGELVDGATKPLTSDDAKTYSPEIKHALKRWASPKDHIVFNTEKGTRWPVHEGDIERMLKERPKE